MLYIVRQYPMLCETYIQAEIDALRDDYDIHVVTYGKPEGVDTYAENPAPYSVVRPGNPFLSAVRHLRPNLIHAHWMITAPEVMEAARHARVPYTMRAHSFDTLPASYMKPWFDVAPVALGAMGRDERLLGVLAFPMSRGFLTRAGLPDDKVIDCFPAVDVGRFLDHSPNGDGVMNVGACLPKKGMEQFIELARRMPDLHFDLYPVGYDVRQLAATNHEAGSPVEIHTCVQHSRMPAVFKAHRWLVYTADFTLKNVGWPLSIAEAQAAGCGVVMANIRPDLAQYVGDGGFLYDSIDEVEEIIRGPVPDDVRERGFELAARSDIQTHKKLLTDLWNRALY